MRDTKHHCMQGPLSWHCKDWKDVLFFRVAFENGVYKPGYSARS